MVDEASMKECFTMTVNQLFAGRDAAIAAYEMGAENFSTCTVGWSKVIQPYRWKFYIAGQYSRIIFQVRMLLRRSSHIIEDSVIIKVDSHMILICLLC